MLTDKDIVTWFLVVGRVWYLVVCKMAEVPPTRMNLQVFKGKQVGAKKGFDLLKSKADALKVCFNDLVQKSKNPMPLKIKLFIGVIRPGLEIFARTFTTQKLAWRILPPPLSSVWLKRNMLLVSVSQLS